MCLLQCLHCTDEACIGRNRGNPAYIVVCGITADNRMSWEAHADSIHAN